MFEWLMNYRGPLGFPSMRDIISIPDRYRQFTNEGRDAEMQKSLDLKQLYKEQREGLFPSPSTGLPIDEEMRKWYQLEKLRRTGGRLQSR